MSKFRKVYTHFWTDPKVVEEMTPEDRYLFLYLLTNDKSTQIGIYPIMVKQIAFDTGYSIETVHSIFERLEHRHGVVKYNPETREVAIRNWGKYNLTHGGKPMQDCVRSELKRVKDRSLVKYVGECIENEVIREIFLGSSNESEPTAENPKVSNEEAYQNACNFYQENFGVLSAYIGEEICNAVDEFGVELVIEAMKIALSVGARNWRYTYGILRNWRDHNVKTLADVAALDLEFEQRRGGQMEPEPTQLQLYVHDPSAGEDEG